MLGDDEPAEETQTYSWKRSDGTVRAPEAEDDNNDEVAEDDVPIVSMVDDLPLFADDANKQLHAQIRAKEKRFQVVKNEILETTSRYGIMDEHLKNVKSELLNTQSLQNSKLKEISTEEHLRQVSDREVGRIKQELRKLDVVYNDVENKLNAIQNFLFKGNADMDNFKMQMNWNQDELEQWALAAKQKEEDNLALEKYTRADDTRIKELNLEIEKLTKGLQAQKQLVENEATETQAKQIELDKTAEEFRIMHEERQKLVNQWQDTIEAMKRRDAEIAAASEQFAAKKMNVEEKKDALNEHKHRLKLQEQDNNEVTIKIQAKERLQSKLRSELQAASARFQEFRDQVEILKNQLTSTVTHLNQQRAYNSNKRTHLERLQDDLEATRQRYKTTKKILDATMNSTVDAETLAKNAESDLNAMEAESKRFDKEIALLKDQMFRRSQMLFNLRQTEAGLIAEISGAQAASRNLSAKIKLLEQSALRQQELVYNGEFQIQQMERKVSRASGERTADETKAMKAEIEVLQTEYDAANAQFTMLQTQCKKLSDERTAQDRAKRALLKTREEITAKIAVHQLENESAGNLLKGILKEKEELLVQHDLQKLEVKRLKDFLNTRADEVFTLENREFQLKKSMEERKREINVHREVQRAQVKAAEEERHKVSVEFAEREMRIKKLQAKFETLCKTSPYGNTDEDGQERSQAYFVIKAAQRREELQREGDELDDKIRVAEKEVRALTKTLAHLEGRNTEYRKSFHRADMVGEEAVKMNQLEDQVKTTEDTLFKRKKELQRLELEMESEQNRISELETQYRHFKDHNENLHAAQSQVLKELEMEKEKIMKVSKRLDRLVKDFRQQKQAESTIEEKVLDIYTSKEINHSLLYTLGQLAQEFPELSDSLNENVKGHNLHIPALPPGTVATRSHPKKSSNDSRPPSARSDRSAASDSSVKSTTSSNGRRRVVAMGKAHIGL
ncbi:flagella associated protein [Thraustotheca clavata]|uniref:Flagella associated protein n=1 Tax=Thraustotheca clavata TaxID=74557 RepID=A0A1V9ZXT6_9STRA|nr:flagella associated protein [Thraustotheca clavata]